MSGACRDSGRKGVEGGKEKIVIYPTKIQQKKAKEVGNE